MKFPVRAIGLASLNFLGQRAHEAGEFLFPATCAFCGEPGEFDQPLFCRKCSGALDELARLPLCAKCAMPLGAAGNCPHCRGRGVFPFETIVALGPFRDPLKELIHHAKFHRRWNLGEALAGRLAAQARAATLLAACDCAVAVPLYWARQIHRGYNQAEVIARSLGLPIAHPLARVKDTEPQTGIHSWKSRANNVRDAFGLVDRRSVCDKRVLLVDDVTTTRSTLRSAARSLWQARPRSALGWTHPSSIGHAHP